MNKPDRIEIYTDGACSGNPGLCGIGIVLKYRDSVKEVGRFIGHGTNNIAELTAVLEGLKLIKRPEIPTLLYTDSQYALGVISLGWKAKKNQDLIEEIRDEMKRFSHLRIVKVEGHAGVFFNDRADELARLGVAEGQDRCR